ncbi:MAG: hypothetical protein ACKVK3_11510 [Acidimicrobiales bacterium]
MPELATILPQLGGKPAIRFDDGTDAMTDIAAHGELDWGDWKFVVRLVLTDQVLHVLSPAGTEIATG